MGRQGYTVTAYYYRFSMSGIQPPPKRATVDKLVFWNASGIQIPDDLSWLNVHKHGW